jgi:hypothetical protein
MWPCSGLPWRKRLAADGGSHFLGLSSDGSEVRHQDPLHFELGLVSGWLIRMSHSDRLLAGELASLLCCLALNVSLLSMSSCSLPPPRKVCHRSRGSLVFGCGNMVRAEPSSWSEGLEHPSTMVR